jgi:hypothetical protein
MNTGRVAAKKAGAASTAIPIPALKAYLRSRSLNLEPRIHSDCFNRPTKDKLDRRGVCKVFGAWGLTLGNEGCLTRCRDESMAAT